MRRECSTRARSSIGPRTGFNAHDEARAARILAGGAREACRIAELPRPLAPDIGRELADDLVAEAKAKLDVGKARADAVFGHVLTSEIDLGHRLQDQADPLRSEEHTSELQSLMRHSYAVFCLK